MRPQRQTRVPDAPPPRWSTTESVDYQEERNARIAEMMARAQKHAAKAALRRSDAERMARLYGTLERLGDARSTAARSPGAAAPGTDAVLNLETLIVRARLRRARQPT